MWIGLHVRPQIILVRTVPMFVQTALFVLPLSPWGLLGISPQRLNEEEQGNRISEIRFVGARDRKQVHSEMIRVVFRADGLQELVRHLVPTPRQIKRLVEGVRILDLDQDIE